jgi:AhpD family alkylhydroperoxidase
MTTDLTTIDPALGLMSEFSRLSAGTTQAIHSMRQKAIFADGLLPAKHKALAAVLWAVSARCEPCIKFYVQQAKRLGASKEETGELLAVASAMGGCVGEMWALKAFHAYVNGSREDHAPPGCCTT